MIIEIAMLIAGIIILFISSEITVQKSVELAKALGIPAFIIGIVLVSLGTDIPEITNSLISSSMGHGDINVGNVFGSPLAQISLVLAFAVLLGRPIQISRPQIARLGVATIAATLLAVLLAGDGDLTRSDAIILILSYALFLLYMTGLDPRNMGIDKIRNHRLARGYGRSVLSLFAAILGVIAGSWLVVNSAISISHALEVPEMIVSFFIIGLGTSLPELAVGLAAVRKGEFGLAIGDSFGSNVTDLTIALGAGPLLFPNSLSADLVNATGAYLIAATALIVAYLGWRGKIDRMGSIILILIYLGSYLLLPLLS
jgi:cation:H+ antiporter